MESDLVELEQRESFRETMENGQNQCSEKENAEGTEVSQSKVMEGQCGTFNASADTHQIVELENIEGYYETKPNNKMKRKLGFASNAKEPEVAAINQNRKRDPVCNASLNDGMLPIPFGYPAINKSCFPIMPAVPAINKSCFPIMPAVPAINKSCFPIMPAVPAINKSCFPIMPAVVALQTRLALCLLQNLQRQQRPQFPLNIGKLCTCGPFVETPGFCLGRPGMPADRQKLPQFLPQMQMRPRFGPCGSMMSPYGPVMGHNMEPPGPCRPRIGHDMEPRGLYGPRFEHDMEHPGLYGPRIGHDMERPGLYGPRIGHDVGPYGSSMRPPGPNMDTQGMEASSSRYPPPRRNVERLSKKQLEQATEATAPTTDKEKEQPEVVEENKPEQKPVKSRPVISVSIPGTVWCVVRTNNGQHFFYNPTKHKSVWKMPEELKNRPDVEKLLSPKPEGKTEKKEQQSVQEEPPSKKFKSETEVKEENTNEGAQNIENNVTSDDIRKEEVQEQRLHSSFSLKSKNTSMPSKEVEDFKQFLVENVKVSTDSFTSFKSRCFKNPGWTMELSEKEKIKLFGSRLNEVHKKNREIFWSILDDMNLPLEAVWSKRVRKQIQADPRSVNYTDGQIKREDAFALYMHKKNLKAKGKFQEPLSETELITSETKVMLQQEKEQPKVVKEKKLEAIEEKKSEVIDDIKLEAIEEMKSEPKPEQKPVKSRPVISISIPGTFWCVVRTNNGKQFFYNPTKRHSVWEMPEELKNIPYVVKLLSPKLEMKTEKAEQQSVQEEPPSKKFKSEAKVKEENANEDAQNIALGQEAELRSTLSLEVRMQQFRELLVENNISAHSTWERELHKIVFDNRYLLLRLRERQQVFEEYVKDRAKEEHEDESRKMKEKTDLYRQLLEESNLNVKSTFQHFADKHSTDKRFRIIDKMQDRESMFLGYISELAKQEKQENGLIKEKVTSDDIRKEEVQEQRLHSSSVKRKNTSMPSKEVEDFKQFLVENVKDDKDSFTDFKARCSKNCRWTMELSEKEKKKLYNSHINEIHKNNREILWSILDDMNLPLKAAWGKKVRRQVKADPRYLKYTGSKLDDEFVQYKQQKLVKAKREFQELLSEISFTEIKAILQQKYITVSSVGYYFRTDKRFTALSKKEREQMFMAYINELRTFIFVPGHAVVQGNERADYLADGATITSGPALDKSDVINAMRDAYHTDYFDNQQDSASFSSGHSPCGPVMQTPEMTGLYRPQSATPMSVMGTYSPSMGLAPVVGHPSQNMGYLGPGMRPTRSITVMSEPQMGSSRMHPIPQLKPVTPNYSTLSPNLPSVEPVNQPADNLWVETAAPTGQVYYYNSKTRISSWERPQNVCIITQAELETTYNNNFIYQGSTETERNMAMKPSQTQTIVQQKAAKDVKTDSGVSSDESEEEVVEEKKNQTEMIEERKPESKAEQKPEPKAKKKPARKSGPVASTPIPDTVWCVVRTNDGKHFFYNPTKRRSVWKIPEELKNRPDVEKLLSSKPEVKTAKKEEQCVQEEPPLKKIKLETEVKKENTDEGTQNLLGKEAAIAIEVQALEPKVPKIPKHLRCFLSFEVRIQQFKELLAENNVSANSTWENILHKIKFDDRFMLLRLQERKLVFQEYVDRYNRRAP